MDPISYFDLPQINENDERTDQEKKSGFQFRKAYKICVKIAIVIICISVVRMMAENHSHSSSSTNYGQSSSYSEPKLKKLEREMFSARDRFQNEINKIPAKSTRAAYQGIFRQKLFWDANDAWYDFEDKVRALQRELRREGLPEMAESYEETLRDFRSRYEYLKRSMS